jgi:hypothetical protein
MDNQKLDFLRSGFIPLLRGLDANARGKWGRMNGQQMIEHFAISVRVASGREVYPQYNKGEILEKSRAFLASEMPLRENTRNPVLPEAPQPNRFSNIGEAVNDLHSELMYFFDRFEHDPELKTSNPLFGELDYSMNVQFLHKHAIHHLRQFGLLESR